MDIYVARQPIFDRNMNVYGYELLYRKSTNNFYEGINDDQATAELINNSFLSLDLYHLTEGKRAFINFSDDMIIKEIPFLLPKDDVVIEILERSKSSEQLIEVCRKLKKNGYMTAVDDFAFQDEMITLLPEVSLVKMEYPAVPIDKQMELLRQYHGKVQFLAEKVETVEDYQQAVAMGYDYFQGYFFSKPVIFQGKDVPNLDISMIRLIKELQQEQPEYQRLAEIIETDLGMSYKLLRMVNSAFYGSQQKFHSIKSALVRIGINEIRKWIFLLMLKDVSRVENQEIIKNSLIRAKMMELLAIETGRDNKRLEYFLTGLFSMIHILLNRDIQSIIGEIELTEDVKETLLGKDTKMGEYLQCVIEYEKADWNYFEVRKKQLGVDNEHLSSIYLKAIDWEVKLQVY